MQKTRKTASKLLLAVIITALTLTLTACNKPIDKDNKDSGATDTTKGLFQVDTVIPESSYLDDSDSESTEEETTAPEPVLEPEKINPLTGLEAMEDYTLRRPVAIMINNIPQAIPQEGISYADVMYECIVEGYLTRLMMVVSDYEKLPVVGSVRSSREYYIDFAADYDAVYIHAGGSTEAYRQMKLRRTDHIDGVNMYTPDMFYRDTWRLNHLGKEHSLVTTGEGIADGIDYHNISTHLADGFDSPLDFVDYGSVKVPEGESGQYVRVTYSASHKPYFEYNSDDSLYYRYQFLGDEHIDKGTGEQLSFTNVILLYMPTTATDDYYGHMSVKTTGSGEGYYFTMGRYEPIRWEKTGVDVPMKLYNSLGEELLINRGKTFFQICTKGMEATTEIR